jgi:hypothetical protein
LRPSARRARCPAMESILIIGVFLLAFVALNFYEFGRGD